MSLDQGRIFLPVRGRFDLAALIARSALVPPWEAGGRRRPWLERPERLPDGSVRLLRIGAEAGGVVLRVTGPGAREIESLAPLAVRVRRALRLDGSGQGRRLRGTTVFEDLVGVLVALDVGADRAPDTVRRLLAFGGRCPADRRRRAFPTPEALAVPTLAELRRRTGLGPAAAWVRSLARDVARGARDPRVLDDLPPRAAARALREIDGLDADGVRAMLRALGHADGGQPGLGVRPASTPARRSRRAARS